jgi:hypothetical protein
LPEIPAGPDGGKTLTSGNSPGRGKRCTGNFLTPGLVFHGRVQPPARPLRS